MEQATQIFPEVETGGSAAEAFLPLVYDQLRRLAAAKLAGEAPGHTLQATALVHEAWLRLPKDQHWNGQSHFLAVAAEAMRRILIDRARRRQAVRHGGGQHRVAFDDIPLASPMPVTDERLLVVHEALSRLEKEDSPKAELVKLRYFVGLSIQEVAKVLEISEATAKRHWAFARAWLQREIRRIEGNSE